MIHFTEPGDTIFITLRISMKKLFKKMVPLKFKYLLASLHRRRINHVTFIGITGSAGKTTTTDLTATILANFGPCQQTFQYNMPAAIVGTVWHTNKVHRYCIAELAAYGPGTLDISIRLVKPDIAVITVIGRDHYNAFKGMEAIAAEKEKVVLALPTHGTAVLNIDDPQVRSIGERCNRRIIWFGEGVGATLRLREARSRWPEPLTILFEYQDKTYEVRTQLHGTHMAIPVLASLGVALAANLPLEKTILAIALVQPIEGRMQVITGDDGVVFIRDDCKSPQWSLDAPLKFLREARAYRKIAIIGTISDSSGDAAKRYKRYCRQFREVADIVVFVGSHAHRALRARQNESDTTIQGFSNIRDVANYLQTELRRGDLVLLKGSYIADHLLRLIINRARPIQCWKDHCGVEAFCDKCPRLYKPSPNISFAAPIDLHTGPAVSVFAGLGNHTARFLLSLKSLLRNLGLINLV
jgi:UDP-N-acetylmuramoyl-tripeptide--D-alanyl-D-alanine ligase